MDKKYNIHEQPKYIDLKLYPKHVKLTNQGLVEESTRSTRVRIRKGIDDMMWSIRSKAMSPTPTTSDSTLDRSTNRVDG